MKAATNPVERWAEDQVCLYSIEEARRILGCVGRSWLYSEIAAGRLRPLKLGTRTMFTNKELARYIAARESEAAK